MIKLSIPHLSGNENKYAQQAIESTWIVPLGPYVDDFEHRLGKFLGTEHVVALSAGTAALHLGLVMAGVEKDDEVICQSLTFSASCNPIVYLGAHPVFVDSEPDTWNISPLLLEEAIKDRLKVTGKLPKAIIVVHLYGMPAKMNEILAIASRYGIPIVEDAAEALGSKYDARFCSTLGEFGVLSFNGNKLITTSGGGALVCKTAEEVKRIKFLSTQAREDRPYYYHTTIGYNYRLSNVSAAIGCAQIEDIEFRLARRRQIHDMYVLLLAGIKGLSVHCNPSDKFDSNFWLTTILFDPSIHALTPDEIRIKLLEKNIETRLIWRPMHMQPIYADAPAYLNGCSEQIFKNGLCLPSGSSLSDEEIEEVCRQISAICS